MVATVNDSGVLENEQRYLPFGQIRTDIGLITQTDFGYTGQRNSGYTGLMDYKARFYDGSLGRFLQPDSIVPGMGNPQNLNRYSYVGNSPTNFVDPTGHFIVFVIAGVAFDLVTIAFVGAISLSIAHNVFPGREQRIAAISKVLDSAMQMTKGNRTNSPPVLSDAAANNYNNNPNNKGGPNLTTAMKWAFGISAVMTALYHFFPGQESDGGDFNPCYGVLCPPTVSPISTATSTSTITPTNTPTLKPTNTATSTLTMTPTNTATSIPTATPYFLPTSGTKPVPWQ